MFYNSFFNIFLTFLFRANLFPFGTSINEYFLNCSISFILVALFITATLHKEIYILLMWKF